MTDYDKLNQVFEQILNEDERYSLDPKVLAARLVGKNRGVGSADTETRNIFINEFISQGLNALQSALSSGMIGSTSGSTRTATTPPVTFGGMKYTKGPNGWIDKRGRKADDNTARLLDRAAQQAQSSTTSVEQPNTNTISNFMVNWFDTYMRGSRVNSNMAPEQVKAIADRIQQAYQKEQGGSLFRRQGQPGKETREEVARLGHLAWGLYHTRMGMSPATSAGDNPTTTPTDRPRGGQTPPGSTDTSIDNRIDLGALTQGVRSIVGMINKFDQGTKRKAIGTILRNTNMLANVDQIVDAIEADKMNRFELEALIRAAQNKLGNENPAQGDLLAVGANDNQFPKPSNVTPIGQGRQRRT